MSAKDTPATTDTDGVQGTKVASGSGRPEDSGGDDEKRTVSELPLDQVFEILKNQRRRVVLRYLEAHEGPVTLGELAEEVAAIENDTDVRRVTSSERKCAYVGLYQCHLPKMDDMDIVEFDDNRGRIEIGPNAAQLEQYLDFGESSDPPWALYYPGISVVGLVVWFLITALIGVGFPAVLWSAVVLVSVGGLSVVHLLSEDTTGAVDRWLDI